MRRAAFMTVLALLTLTAACGSDDDDATATAGADDAEVTTPTAEDDEADAEVDETSDDETDDEADDPATGPPDEDGGDSDDDGVTAADLCELLPAADVAAASGLDVTETSVLFGGATNLDVEYQTEGCTYATADDEGELKVSVAVDPEGGAAALYATLLDISSTSSMDDYPHQVVDGLGDGAFHQAGLRSNDLLVLSGEDLVVVKGETPAGEQLGRAEMQAVAEAALAALA